MIKRFLKFFLDNLDALLFTIAWAGFFICLMNKI